MEQRHVIAYLIIAAALVALTFVWRRTAKTRRKARRDSNRPIDMFSGKGPEPLG
jgi:hypothetical protein